ncbi:hypothetical protein DL95DRAFT_489692 [Leptodontidium sp. 2 PMI_412]|nr:hypothetical protein DL95DRAFT_489692 [Leptodontidium sp. 2 PMI_412]
MLETYRYAASAKIMRGRKTNQTDVPPLEDPDRKRVLTVLAQRRYRQRQRQRLQELERKANQLSRLSPRSSPQSEGSMIITSNNEQHSELEVPGQVSYGFSIDSNESFASLLATAMQGNGTNALQLYSDMSRELQDLETSQYQFPDDALLDVSELKVARAIFEIAILLRCHDTIYEVGALRTFSETTSPGGAPLPPSFLPTEEQKEFPHHPVLDILPRPAVRSKLIRIFNRAPYIRPRVTRGPMAVVKLL